jgi:hypothetical protein
LDLHPKPRRSRDCFVIWELPHLDEEKESKPAPDGELDRVNVAGRHLGYRLC